MRLLASGSFQPEEGKAVLGTSIKDPREEGGERANLKEVLLRGIPGETYFWVGDVGGDPPYGEDPGGFLPLGGSMYHG